MQPFGIISTCCFSSFSSDLREGLLQGESEVQARMNGSEKGVRPTVVGRKYSLGRKIGKDGSGEVYEGTHIETGDKYAIKLERLKKNPATRLDGNRSKLSNEAIMYMLLKRLNGIAKTSWYGVEGDYQVMVFELLGPSLADLFKLCNRKFSLKTVLMLADQLIDRLESVHGNRVIHRNLKPENILMGPPSDDDAQYKVYVTDFGSGVRYWDYITYEHICYRENIAEPIDNANFASINTHRGIEQSRRDDLESLGYILMYFLMGSLPKVSSTSWRKIEKHDELIKNITDETVREVPPEFADYFKYCRSLGFDETPDYAYLKRLFSDLFTREGFKLDYQFDWTEEQQSAMKTNCFTIFSHFFSILSQD